MTQPSTTAANSPHSPPLAKDLDAVQVRYTWKVGDGGPPPPLPPKPEGQEAEATTTPEQDTINLLETQLRHYTAALEDIVTLALSNADYKERAIMMHRRAVAALSGHPKR